MNKGRILLADNQEAGLIATSEFLELQGYQVVPARTLEETQHALRHTWVHLAILDIRMVDDRDEEDVSGLLLAKREEFLEIPKIINTGFPSYKSVREALSPIVGELPPAVAYVAKQEGPEKLLEAVELAFNEHVGINPHLVIRWLPGGLLSFPYLAGLVEQGIEHVQDDEIAGELEDLLRKAFYPYDHLVISQLSWEQSGRACLEAFAYQGTEGSHFLVTCGAAAAIQNERQREQELDPKNSLFPAQSRVERTLHYALLLRDLTPLGMGRLQSFAQFLAEASEKQARQAVDDLYGARLAASRAEGRSASPAEALLTLEQAYRRLLDMEAILPEKEELYQRMWALADEGKAHRLVKKISLGEGQLTVQFNNEEPVLLPDPISWLYETGASLDFEFAWGHSAGELTAGNALVANSALCLPSNLSASQPAPLHCDFLALEADIRFSALFVPNLLTLYDFESQLLKTSALDEPIPIGSVEPDCRKALTAILAIRQQAAQASGSELPAYLVGLYFFTLRGLLEYRPQVKLIQDEAASLLHRLLLAGMLCQALERMGGLLAAPDGLQPAADPLGLELLPKRRVVRLGSKVIKLTPTEQELMAYLYERQGQVCTREELLHEVLKVANPDVRSDKTLLNTHIWRLRKKIENNPSRPAYLLTVEEEGYRLVTRPE